MADCVESSSLGAFAFLGLLFSFFIPETMGMSLEKLAGEEQSESDDEEIPINPWLDKLWAWLRKSTLRNHSNGVEMRDDLQIPLSRPEEVRDATSTNLRNHPGEPKFDGGLKVLEGEFDKVSGGSSDRSRSADRDEIQRIA
ncbi:uncharacterized protein Z518_06671 [Rhinocladiella mackenziei CBS 650.93]|uniref:Uncharacterized protein n=1 Tax=Rhinocladiella mackenziei CBS 650.93 TaxID=1442369 RepID=A0A0D2IIK1_9EURO|nr:uncharacterized protein Z518_06671 [Rhinocladiella mackenziei CBS 650.93]KIX03121.1 hypothetical protein Z518_06671 [Rhinocladiella mackenziei CBS 650.93]